MELPILPNILHLPDIVQNDSDTAVEDKFEEQLLHSSTSFVESQVVMDSIPDKFINLDLWPQQTNLRCWNCDFVFNTRPIFIPISIHEFERKLEIATRGNFCSFCCTARYIEDHYTDDSNNHWRIKDMFYYIFFIFNNKRVHYLKPAPPRTIMTQYGGAVTKENYKLQIQKIEQDNLDGKKQYSSKRAATIEQGQQNLWDIVNSSVK